MKVYLLYRVHECVDCGNEGLLEGVFATLGAAMSEANEVGIAWIASSEGELRTWKKHRGVHYIQEWNAE